MIWAYKKAVKERQQGQQNWQRIWMSQAELEETKNIDSKSEHPLILSLVSVSKLLLISTKSVTLQVDVPKIRSTLEKIMRDLYSFSCI